MRRNLSVLAVVAVMVSALTPSVAFANGTDTNGGSDFDLAAVDALGLLDGPQALPPSAREQNGLPLMADAPPAPTGELSPDSGLTVSVPSGTVALSPSDVGSGELVADGDALHYTADDYGVLLTGEGSAANAGYIVINDAAAPTSYSFDMTANGAPAVLVETDGLVRIEDRATGEVVNTLSRPWAVDAEGSSITTWYSVEGSVLTQHVDHQGATYPVVADPRLMCDALFCTFEYTRAETKSMASTSTFPSALVTAACTALGTPLAGVLCGLSGAYVISKANEIRNSGKCVGIRRFHYTTAVPPLIVAVNCYA